MIIDFMNCGGIDRFWYVLQYLISNLSRTLSLSALSHTQPSRSMTTSRFFAAASKVSLPSWTPPTTRPLRTTFSSSLNTSPTAASSVRPGVSLPCSQSAPSLRDSRRIVPGDRAAQVPRALPARPLRGLSDQLSLAHRDDPAGDWG